MKLSYAELTEALGRMNNIPYAGMGAFRARLRKLQGEGIPGDANPGKGKRVEYTLPLVVEAAVAVELLQMGWSAPQAAALVKAHRSDIYTASLMSVTPYADGADDVLLIISPEALSQHSLTDKFGAISFVTRKKFSEMFSTAPAVDPVTGDFWRWSVIDLSIAMVMLMGSIAFGGLPDDLVTDAVVEGVRDHQAAIIAFRQTRLNNIVGEKSGRVLDGDD